MDAVLVADASRRNTKIFSKFLKSKNRKEATEHQRVHRPWGSYETLVLGGRFQVKQIVVNLDMSVTTTAPSSCRTLVVVSGTPSSS